MVHTHNLSLAVNGYNVYVSLFFFPIEMNSQREDGTTQVSTHGLLGQQVCLVMPKVNTVIAWFQ
jgi:hypothetical protein